MNPAFVTFAVRDWRAAVNARWPSPSWPPGLLSRTCTRAWQGRPGWLRDRRLHWPSGAHRRRDWRTHARPGHPTALP